MDKLYQFILTQLMNGGDGAVIIILSILIFCMISVIAGLYRLMLAKDKIIQDKDQQLQAVYIHLSDTIKNTHTELSDVLTESLDKQREFGNNMVNALHDIDKVLTEVKTYVVLQSQQQMRQIPCSPSNDTQSPRAKHD